MIFEGTVVHTRTREKWQSLAKILASKGYRFEPDMNTPVEESKYYKTVWNTYRESCCMRIEERTRTINWGSRNTYSENTILSYEQYLKLIKYGLSSARIVIGYYKRNAKRRDIIFNLTEEECIRILVSDCYYCGNPPNNVQERKGSWGEFTYSGIDRIDSGGSYTIDNVVPCCKDCNFMKKNFSINDFYQKILTIYLNLKDKNCDSLLPCGRS
jgi:hypothetical protein